MTQPIHKTVWLWIPITILVAQIGIEVFTPAQYLPAMHSEGGPHETLQFLFAVIALIYAFKCLHMLWPEKHPLLMSWVICFCLGCAYIAGEEVSWGQHIFDWRTPEFWNGVNDQNETNLHNTSSWLDQKPRLLLLIGTIVGGLIIPALAKFKPSTLPQKLAIIFPPVTLAVTAAFALLIKIIDKAQDGLDQTLLTRAAEVEELYLYYFVLLYLVVLYRRIKPAK